MTKVLPVVLLFPTPPTAMMDFLPADATVQICPEWRSDDRISLPCEMSFPQTVISSESIGPFVTRAAVTRDSAVGVRRPGAELIGNWSFPFTYPVDGTVQSATGAMIAKRP